MLRPTFLYLNFALRKSTREQISIIASRRSKLACLTVINDKQNLLMNFLIRFW